jgi:peptidyl-prolyl cis-trans isomerase D
MITQSVDVSDQELSDVFFLRNQKLKIDYLEFSQSEITEEVPVSDEEARAYYDKNPEKYRVDEMARAQYIVFDPQEFVGRMDIAPEDIQDCYNADLERFTEPQQVRARHILLKADKQAEPEKAQAVRKQAEELLEKIKKGADFAALAKKHSQDEASAAEGGDLGFFGKGVMVPPFEKVAFSLQPGELSEIVETQFGYHIIKVEEKNPRRVRSLLEVREEIVRELQQEAAEREVRKASRRAFNRLFKSRDLEGYAETNDLSLRETGLFSFGGGPEDAQSENAFSKQLFALQVDELAPVFAIGKKYYLIKLKEKKEAHIAPLEGVRDAVVTAVQREKRLELARGQAQDALRVLSENGFDWAAVAKKNRLEIKTVELTRSGEFVPGLGRNPALKQAAFRLKDGQTADRVFATESSSVLVRARQKILPSQEAFEQEKKALRQQLLQAKQQEAFDHYIIELKKQYPVDIDRDLFETL